MFGQLYWKTSQKKRRTKSAGAGIINSNLQRFSSEQCAILHCDVNTKQILAHHEIEPNTVLSHMPLQRHSVLLEKATLMFRVSDQKFKPHVFSDNKI